MTEFFFDPTTHFVASDGAVKLLPDVLRIPNPEIQFEQLREKLDEELTQRWRIKSYCSFCYKSSITPARADRYCVYGHGLMRPIEEYYLEDL